MTGIYAATTVSVVLLLLLQQPMQSSGQTSLCGSRNLTLTRGITLDSHPGAQFVSYSSNMRCYWQFTAPPGLRIMAWFVFLEIEAQNDGVLLLDGPVGSAAIARIEDSVGQKPVFTSSNNVLTVHFYTNENVNMRGFTLMFDLVQSPPNKDCGVISPPTSPGSTGFLSSHPTKGRSPYPANMRCSWTLPQQPGKTTQVTVLMSLGSGDCLRLVAESPAERQVVSYCGWTAMNNLALRSDADVTVEFSSDGSLESLGFSIRYSYNESLTTPMRTPFQMIAMCSFSGGLGAFPIIIVVVAAAAVLIITGLAVTVGCLAARNRKIRRNLSMGANPAGCEYAKNIPSVDAPCVRVSDAPPSYADTGNI